MPIRLFSIVVIMLFGVARAQTRPRDYRETAYGAIGYYQTSEGCGVRAVLEISSYPVIYLIRTASGNETISFTFSTDKALSQEQFLNGTSQLLINYKSIEVTGLGMLSDRAVAGVPHTFFAADLPLATVRASTSDIHVHALPSEWDFYFIIPRQAIIDLFQFYDKHCLN